MIRDWDLIRELLLSVEKLIPGEELTLSDFPAEKAHQYSNHVLLLDQAGFLDCYIDRDSYAPHNRPRDFNIRDTSLTWQGHDYLEAVRNDGIWSKTKNQITSKGGAMTFDMIKAVATEFIKKAVLGDA